MTLSDVDIKKAIEAGDIRIDNFDEKRLQPASYDLQLGNVFTIAEPHETEFVDPHNKIFPKKREIVIKDNESFTLHPGISILGESRDFFGSDKYLIQLSGKSSLARVGLIVHNTAGVVNPGHYLNIVFELYNLSNVPIILRPGMDIAQILFTELSSPTAQSYKNTGRYTDNNRDHFKGANKK